MEHQWAAKINLDKKVAKRIPLNSTHLLIISFKSIFRIPVSSSPLAPSSANVALNPLGAALATGTIVESIIFI